MKNQAGIRRNAWQAIGRLAEGPLDIVGDVHGELDALKRLLEKLGHGSDGTQSHDAKLVFVGDLVDRGPDSPGVYQLVRRLVDSGKAQCVLGNHEMNILRGDAKEGNGWAFAQNHDVAKNKFMESVALSDDRNRAGLHEFFASLPVALENDQLRVVHACWSDQALEALGTRAPGKDPGQLFQSFDEQVAASEYVSDRLSLARAEGQGVNLSDKDRVPELLRAQGEIDAYVQMGNPLRVLTSGVERLAIEPFYSTGKWRFVNRVKWWDEYQNAKPVVIGHYWRWPPEVNPSAYGKHGADLFENVPADAWHGARENVFCVDYAVGRRFEERAKGIVPGSTTRLAALRWRPGEPNCRLVFDLADDMTVGVPQCASGAVL